MSEEKEVKVKLVLIHETDKAYQVENPNAHKLWLPKSQVDELSRSFEDMEEIIELDVPEWLAKESELID